MTNCSCAYWRVILVFVSLVASPPCLWALRPTSGNKTQKTVYDDTPHLRQSYGKVYLLKLFVSFVGRVNEMQRSNQSISHILMNIARHTAHTIVSWPIPKHLLMIHISNLMVMMEWITSISTIIKRQVSWSWKHTQSIYRIKYNWDNSLKLRHALDRIHLTRFWNSIASDESA